MYTSISEYMVRYNGSFAFSVCSRSQQTVSRPLIGL